MSDKQDTFYPEEDPSTLEDNISKFQKLGSFNLKDSKQSMAPGWTINNGGIHAQYQTKFEDKDGSMINMVPGFSYITKDKREIVMIAVKDQKTARSKMVAFHTVLLWNGLLKRSWKACDLTKYHLVRR
jgi:hypothetical protein